MIISPDPQDATAWDKVPDHCQLNTEPHSGVTESL